MVLIIGLGVTLIVILAAISIVLWRKVWAIERVQRERVKFSLENETRTNHIFDSLYVLAHSVSSDQVRIAEAGIRMATLLDYFELTCEEKHLFEPIIQVYNRTRHIPTHNSLNVLDKKERFQFEKELRMIERELSEGVKKAARYITDTSFREKRNLH
jgi:predicted  nucleic acid-binding Zn ribbon protein